ncbi:MULTISPECIES: hypothetical protein [unclassified Sphingomonas]|jgi:hypothetical protein|uniref:hypothetical protein n=1 Tax=unclassified Sphingomonas TaxID=196159 RepID=UPI000A9175DC
MSEHTGEFNTIELAMKLTVAWLSNPNTRVSAAEVTAFLNTMRDSIAALAGSVEATSMATD